MWCWYKVADIVEWGARNTRNAAHQGLQKPICDLQRSLGGRLTAPATTPGTLDIRGTTTRREPSGKGAQRAAQQSYPDLGTRGHQIDEKRVRKLLGASW